MIIANGKRYYACEDEADEYDTGREDAHDYEYEDESEPPK